MRFLKNKIARANEFLLKKREASLKGPPGQEELTNDDLSTRTLSSSSPQNSPNKSTSPQKKDFATPLKTRSTKSIVKNYGRAICSFACSEIAKVYLSPIIEKEKISYPKVVSFMLNAKECIDSLQSFRSILLPGENDHEETAALKRIFIAIGEVFIKYFSVNWIFSGKVVHKDAHLKFRFKMLRRIKNPELFTYLK